MAGRRLCPEISTPRPESQQKQNETSLQHRPRTPPGSPIRPANQRLRKGPRAQSNPHATLHAPSRKPALAHPNTSHERLRTDISQWILPHPRPSAWPLEQGIFPLRPAPRALWHRQTCHWVASQGRFVRLRRHGFCDVQKAGKPETPRLSSQRFVANLRRHSRSNADVVAFGDRLATRCGHVHPGQDTSILEVSWPCL